MASLVAVTLALAAGVQARIWTSADGSKTFEGELKSYDPATGMVGVTHGPGDGGTVEESEVNPAAGLPRKM